MSSTISNRSGRMPFRPRCLKLPIIRGTLIGCQCGRKQIVRENRVRFLDIVNSDRVFHFAVAFAFSSKAGDAHFLKRIESCGVIG